MHLPGGIQGFPLAGPSDAVRPVAPVERGVISVVCGMVVRAHEHQIVAGILSATAQPLDAVSLAEQLAVFIGRGPPPDLTTPVVNALKAIHEIWIVTGHLSVQVLLPLRGNPEGFVENEPLLRGAVSDNSLSLRLPSGRMRARGFLGRSRAVSRSTGSSPSVISRTAACP